MRAVQVLRSARLRGLILKTLLAEDLLTLAGAYFGSLGGSLSGSGG